MQYILNVVLSISIFNNYYNDIPQAISVFSNVMRKNNKISIRIWIEDHTP